MKKEIEAKFCPIDKGQCREKLKENNFILKQSEFLMTRITLHNNVLSDRWGRVRQEAKKVTMTIKRVLDSTKIDGTEEVEIVVDSIELGLQFMHACGFSQTSFQENYREIWTLGDTEVTLDTWPGIPPLIEIEGTDESTVFNICDLLGFKKEDALYGSIDNVYEKIINIPATDIIKLSEITFSSPPIKKV